MSLRTWRFTGLAAAVAAVCAIAAGPAQAQTVPLNNFVVSGKLGLAKLHQSVSIPPGSTFNGSIDLTTSQLTGDVSIPDFTATIRVLGIPTQASLRFVEAAPTSGTFTVLSGGHVSLHATSSAFLYVRRLGLGLIQVPTGTCRTASPVMLPLDFTGPFSFSGFTFNGTTTIPPFVHCGLTTPLLTTLLSGAGNQFTINLTPPTS